MGHDRANSVGDQKFVHPDPVMDAALDWFFLLQSEPDNREIKTGFEAWRSANARHERAFDTVVEAWALPEADEVAQKLAAQTGYERQQQPTNVVALPHRGRTFRGWMSAAAAVILVGVGIQQYPALLIRWDADYVTAAGMQREVTLPDGSRAVLNTDTAIALDFEGGKRSVRLLKGEAYFDVVHDPSHPFDVAAAFSTVLVKGTAFSIRRNEDEDAVALERGHVEVSSKADPSLKASLEPGQALTATAFAISKARPIDGSVTLAWLKGQVFFQDQPFKAVLHELSRYYGHTVIQAGSAFDNVEVTGRYRIDNPELAIRSLATTVGVSVTRLPGGILILR